MKPWRALLAVTAALLAAWLLLTGFAGIERGMPWTPQTRIALEPQRLGSAEARLELRGERVRVHGASAGGVTLLMQEVTPFDAQELRHFSLRLRDVGPVYRGLVVWRHDGVLQAAPLPGMFRARSTLDLGQFEHWQGRIDAIGFALMPTDYLAAPLTSERSFEFVSGELASVSRRGALAALWTAWSAYRPWNGRSNHTSGFELSAIPTPSLQAFVFGLLLLAAGALWLAGGIALLRRHALLILLVALAVPALRQSLQLAMRAEVAGHAAHMADASSWPLSAMPMLAHELGELDARLRTQPSMRVLVWGASGFHREYPAWLLRAHNVASLHHPGQLQDVDPDGLVLVLAGDTDARFDSGVLHLAGQALAAQPLYQGAQLRAWTLQGHAR